MSEVQKVKENHPQENTYFRHSGITFDAKKYKVEFSKEAKNVLWEEIQVIQTTLPSTQDECSEFTARTQQKAMDSLIHKNKSEKKVRGFWEITQELLHKKKKGIPEKIEQKIEKNTQEPSILLYIDVEDSEYIRDQVPLIIRKSSTLESVLHSFSGRLAFAGNQKHKKPSR